MQAIANPLRDQRADGYPALHEPQALHRLLPAYAPTALIDAPKLAARLHVGRVSVKDESARLGLPSFKILGASYAVFRALSERLGRTAGVWASLAEWQAALAPLRPCALACATDGNHGRAVASMARLLGLEARIFVPLGTAPARIDAIAAEGAQVLLVDGSYDQAVARAAEEASDRCLVIADTAWPGYTDVPQWVIDGYATMFNEIDAALAQRALTQPDLVLVQIGVGALAAATVRHYRQHDRTQPQIIGVEPTQADCVLRSIAAGEPISLPGVQHSIMAGLNCGTPSPIAWPVIAAGIDAYIAIEDDWAREGMRALAAAGVVAGESGAAGLAGLLALVDDPHSGALRERLGITPQTHVLVISTEGATDPAAYAEIVGG